MGIAPTNIVGKKILLVDDDISFTQLYSAVFDAKGFNFSIAKDGPEALAKARAEKPSLILLDIMMPGMDGFQVLKQLRLNPSTATIPVWMVTNLSEQINQQTARSLGATDYIVKATATPNQVCDRIIDYFSKAA